MEKHQGKFTQAAVVQGVFNLVFLTSIRNLGYVVRNSLTLAGVFYRELLKCYKFKIGEDVMKNVLAMFKTIVLCLGLTLAVMACGGSDDEGVSCTPPANLEAPFDNISGQWYLKVEYSDGFELLAQFYIEQNGSDLNVTNYSDNVGNYGDFTGYLSGKNMYWEFEDEPGVKFSIGAVSPEDDAFTADLWDCSDGTSGEALFARQPSFDSESSY